MTQGKTQITYLIDVAQEAVAQKGMEATDRETTLACFGWLGGKLDKLPCLDNCPARSRSNGSWKKYMFIGLGIAAGLSGVAGLASKLID